MLQYMVPDIDHISAVHHLHLTGLANRFASVNLLFFRSDGAFRSVN